MSIDKFKLIQTNYMCLFGLTLGSYERAFHPLRRDFNVLQHVWENE
jgi:hypothetical protein